MTWRATSGRPYAAGYPRCPACVCQQFHRDGRGCQAPVDVAPRAPLDRRSLNEVAGPAYCAHINPDAGCLNYCPVVMAAGRGLHSSTSQLNLELFLTINTSPKRPKTP
jgi:hypothetical protein